MTTQADPEEQREQMLVWFCEHFEPPDTLPFDNETGTHLWIRGGPISAFDALQQEFSGIMPDDIIESVANELQAENDEWTPKYDEADEQDE